MKFASIRLIARDIKSLVDFYETLTGRRAEWLAPVFAEIVMPGATLAFSDAAFLASFAPGSAEPGDNRRAIVEFQVAEVDAEFDRMKDRAQVVQTPQDMPWGNRCALFRDPEGTAVLIYTPVTQAAKARFAGR